MRRAWLYRLLRPLAKLLVAIFHRKLQVEHPERMPAEGAAVVAANHPNMMLDVLLLATAQPRTLHFLAKATLFRNPLLARFLAVSGVLPVHRQKDDPRKTGKNVDTFEACHALLAEGGVIALFPEGVSHDREAVLPLRTGAARIVLEAEAARGFTIGVVLVPVGLAFSDRRLFRSDALVVFGEPIDPSRYFETYRNGRERDAVRDLTAELESALRKLTLHVPREEDEKLLATLRQFFSEREGPSAFRLEVDQALSNAVHDFRDRHPIEYSRLRRQVLGYGRALTLLGVTHAGIDRTYRLGDSLRYVLPRFVFAAVGLGPFLAGAALHYLPYKIPAWVARALASEPVEQGTMKLLTGLVTFPLFYGLAVAVSGLAALPLLLLLGGFSLLYLETMSDFWREVRIFVLHFRPDCRIERLKEWRRELTAELEQERKRYEAAPAEALENPLRE